MAEENVSVPARIDIAWVFLLLGETNQAISMLKNLLSGQAQSLEVLNLLDIAYLKKGATEESETTKKRIAAIEDSNAKVDEESIKRQVTGNQNIFVGERQNKLFKKINKYVSEGNYTRAIALYTDLLKQKTRMRSPASTYQNRGALYIKVKNMIWHRPISPRRLLSAV